MKILIAVLGLFLLLGCTTSVYYTDTGDSKSLLYYSSTKDVIIHKKLEQEEIYIRTDTKNAFDFLSGAVGAAMAWFAK